METPKEMVTVMAPEELKAANKKLYRMDAEFEEYGYSK